MADQDAARLPTMKDIDAMVQSVHGNGECTLLCHELLNALEELAGPPPATGILRLRLLARIRALRAQMKALNCALCLPE